MSNTSNGKRHIEDVKIQFVLEVYESINKQIQHMDIKTSILLSWNGISAVLLGRELIVMVAAHMLNFATGIMASCSLVLLIISSIYVYTVLKPRVGAIRETNFTGLLYSGDILSLGKDATERMKRYIDELVAIESQEEIYQQFVKSIVLIADIQNQKHKKFIQALAYTAVAFALLVALIAIVGIQSTNPGF
ncbi:MAG: hypothetical protein ACLFR1_02085 [Spirochaetia bacterium]